MSSATTCVSGHEAHYDCLAFYGECPWCGELEGDSSE
jgi:hypothetical protein